MSKAVLAVFLRLKLGAGMKLGGCSGLSVNYWVRVGRRGLRVAEEWHTVLTLAIGESCCKLS
jgi:hypothetical protein